MLFVFFACLTASGAMVRHSVAFPLPSTYPIFRIQTKPRRSTRSTACIIKLSADDEAKLLLEKARKLREEAAAMSGKTLEEVEEEARIERDSAEERRLMIEEKRNDRGRDSRIRHNRNQVAIPVPDNAKAQIQQAASAVERAFKDGIVRQTVRFALLGEEEMMSGELNEWPGGAQQMYREAGRPLTESLLREIRVRSSKNHSEVIENKSARRSPPTVTAEDIWDFDGSAIIAAKAAEASLGDVMALVFPNTDMKYLKDIESIDKEVGPDSLFLLVNPFWRDVESWGFNILAPNGKKRAQEVVFDHGYETTYAVLRYSVRGEDCVALKAYPFDWQLYAYREDPSWFNQEVPLFLGSSEEEPTSRQFAELLNSRSEFRMSKNMRQMQRMMGNDDQ